MWGNIAEESFDVCDCSSMIASNAFNTMLHASPHQRRAAGAQRRLHSASASASSTTTAAQAFAMVDDNATDKSAASHHIGDDLSFYDGPAAVHGSPRSCGTTSPCMDMDMYSPQSSPASSATATLSHTHLRQHNQQQQQHTSARRSFGDLLANMVDFNSRDSGYGATNASVLSNASSSMATGAAGQSGSVFKFVEPTGTAPKPSPPKQQSCFRPFNSCGTDSVDSMDDEYMDLLDLEQAMGEENAASNGSAAAALPSHFSAIISGEIRTPSPPQQQQQMQSFGSGGHRQPLRRCLSLIENNSQNNSQNSMQCSPVQMHKTSASPSPLASMEASLSITPMRAFKRPEAPAFGSPTSAAAIKRFKAACGSEPSPTSSLISMADKENLPHPVAAASPAAQSQQRHLLRKSISMNDASIMSALARSSTEPDLIGDFSKPYALPLMAGRHRDLKSISAETMARLLRGEFAAQVASFRVVDCRYPYEFEGGHIEGAENLYTQESVLRELVGGRQAQTAQVQPDGAQGRHIVVFHCEFSSERGPKLSRFLRNHDRQCNTNVYPALHYPEVYLLHGGYKEFFEHSEAQCAPQAYRPMLDPAYGQAYRHFRAQTKSWSGGEQKQQQQSDVAAPPANRLMKSRSRLVL